MPAVRKRNCVPHRPCLHRAVTGAIESKNLESYSENKMRWRAFAYGIVARYPSPAGYETTQAPP